ncbi:MAG: DUF3592 domain-containing protein [Bdellovibrionales bacterium]|nr:DUF3592 domain-containing protein [Bdellovibrionales bacterium]
MAQRCLLPDSALGSSFVAGWDLETKILEAVLMIRAVMGFLAVAGLALGGFGGYFIYLGGEVGSWPVTEGEVVTTRIRTELEVSGGTTVTKAARDRLRQHYPSITYRWTVDGESYTGSRYRLGATHEKFDTRAEAQAAARRFTPGTKVPVYYDPNSPSQAVLDPSATFVIYVPLLIGLLFLVTGALGLRYAEAIEQASAEKELASE